MAGAIGAKNHPYLNPSPRSCPHRLLINLKEPKGLALHLAVYSSGCLAFYYASKLVCASYA
jgi:hypothetical protein